MKIPRPSNDEARVAALRRLEILDSQDEIAFDRIVSLAADLYQVPMAFVSFIDAERQWIKSCIGLDGKETARDDSFCGYAIVSDSLMVVPDALEDERFARNPFVLGPPEIRFYAGVPLSTPDGFTVGTLCIADRVLRPDLIETGFERLETLAAVLEDTLELRIVHAEHVHDLQERRRVEADLERSTRVIELLECVAVTANGADSLEGAVASVLDAVRDFTGWPVGHAFLTDELTGDLVSSGVWSAAEMQRFAHLKEVTERTRFAIGEGIVGRTAAKGQPALVSDISGEPNFIRAGSAVSTGLRGWFAFPVLTGSDVAGVLEFFAADEPLPRDDLLEATAQIGTNLGRVVERERAKARLNRSERDAHAARVSADEANHAKSEFLARMSHELRTPLNAILGFGQLLEMDDLGPTQKSNVKEIVRGGRHLLDLINEVLDISRIEAGELTLSLEPVSVPEVIHDCVALMRPLAIERDIRLMVCDQPAGPFAKADRQRLKQVLLNLLSNAIKYNHDGGHVELRCRSSADVVRVEVVDGGVGIAKSQMSELFVPFQRLGAENTSIEGTGLGLALTKRLVEAMGGTISVESENRHGTVFAVTLPIAEPPGRALDDVVHAASLPPEADGTQGILLYIEDNPANLKLVERIVALRSGVELISAMTGALGIDLARQHFPDLILLDLNLPDLDGFEVLARLRADPATAGIQAIVLSADASSGQIQRLLSAGANGYLTKPLDVKSFLSVLDETLLSQRV